MSDQPDLFPGTKPKKRGRPKGDRPALTSAERMERARERVRFALDDPQGDVTTLPDNLLLEAVALAYRKDRAGALFYSVEELFKRLNARIVADPAYGHAYVVRLDLVPKGDTVTENKDIDSATVTESETVESDTVTTKKRTGRNPLLSDEQQSEVRKRHSDGESQTDLAKAFGVSRATIHNVLNAERVSGN